jgi:uncharacterized protein (DUF433 family)
MPGLKPKPIVLTERQRDFLKQVLRRKKSTQQQVRRINVILLSGTGQVHFMATNAGRYVRGAMRYTRITVNPNQMGGAPCLRALRIPVATVVDMVADGMSFDEILKAYPDLQQEDIREALRYAAEAVRERELPLVKVA